MSKMFHSLIILTALVLFPMDAGAEDGWIGGQMDIQRDHKQVVEKPASFQGPGKVRINIKIVPYEKVVAYDLQNEKVVKYRPKRPLNHILRSRIERPNNFYINSYHIEANPIAFSAKTKQYATDLTVFKRYGAYGNIEEKLGTLRLSGKLAGGDGLYELIGFDKALFRDKFQNPVVYIEAGKIPDAMRAPVARKGAKRKGKVGSGSSYNPGQRSQGNAVPIPL